MNRKYLSGTLVLKYPDSFICFYYVLVKYGLIPRHEARVNALRAPNSRRAEWLKMSPDRLFGLDTIRG